MSVFLMKLIAVASMLADHLGTYLYPAYISKDVYLWLRAAGRLAFPLFAFLIVNGYEKTHDVKRYLTRLVAFAVISTSPAETSISEAVTISVLLEVKPVASSFT